MLKTSTSQKSNEGIYRMVFFFFFGGGRTKPLRRIPDEPIMKSVDATLVEQIDPQWRNLDRFRVLSNSASSYVKITLQRR